MHLLATFTAADVDAWQALIVKILEDLGVIAGVALGIWAKVQAQAATTRLDAQHQTLLVQQSQLSDVQMAMPTTPTPASSPPAKFNVTLNHDALADAIVQKQAAAAKPRWSAPSDTIPPKAAQ